MRDSTLAAEPTRSLEGARIELVPGTLFAGRYEIDKELGRGGMGVVYRARDRLVGERVALKLLDGAVSALPDSADMFKREVRTARRITHPNVVRIHDLDAHAEQLFITMQFVDGGDLRSELERAPGGRITPARAASIACDVAEGLAAAHFAGIVHRDLKPENVLCDRRGVALLSDFGIARAYDTLGDSKRPNALESSGSDEANGAILGTPAYMAPEQVAGMEIGPATDLYALGVILFEMLAGTQPFQGATPVALALARLTCPAPKLAEFVPEVPLVLAALTDALLATHPDDRPESAAFVAARALTIAQDLVPSGSESRSFRTNTTGRVALAQPAVPPNVATTNAVAPATNAALAVPFGSGRRTIACLPFSYRGPREHDYLGDAMSDELIEVLGRTKGLRIMSSNAVARLGGERDPKRIAEALDVDYMVEGTVQLAGSRLRVTARLTDHRGEQLMSDRAELEFGDAFAAQDQVGRKVADALRLELETRAHAGILPHTAVELFARGRRILRAMQWDDAHSAVAMLEEAHELAPQFAPILAWLAVATVQVWFLPSGAPARDWQSAAEKAVARALEAAPEIAETHVAAARLASQRGALREAVTALRAAIDIAPTSPEAHHFLGMLECETGRIDEGLARLALAAQLEPAAPTYTYELARAAALDLDHARFDKAMTTVRRLTPGIAATHLALRHAAWSRDAERLRGVVAEAKGLAPPINGLVELVAVFFLGLVPASAVAPALRGAIGASSVRFGALLRQILVEVYAHAGDHESAVAELRLAASTLLYDVAWLDRCPLLKPLHAHAHYDAIAREVRARCATVWSP
ncbi:MAG: protein kinase [Polyangiaceae bacterium]